MKWGAVAPPASRGRPGGRTGHRNSPPLSDVRPRLAGGDRGLRRARLRVSAALAGSPGAPPEDRSRVLSLRPWVEEEVGGRRRLRPGAGETARGAVRPSPGHRTAGSRRVGRSVGPNGPIPGLDRRAGRARGRCGRGRTYRRRPGRDGSPGAPSGRRAGSDQRHEAGGGATRPPLLENTRQETEAFCASLRLRPRRDPMNQDPAFMRVGIRTRVIPHLERALGRNIRSTLVRTAELLRQDAEFLDQLASAARSEVVTESGPGILRLRAGLLGALAPPIAGRIVRRALLDLGALPEAGHVEAVIGLGTARPGRSITLTGGLLARREREYVRLVALP